MIASQCRHENLQERKDEFAAKIHVENGAIDPVAVCRPHGFLQIHARPDHRVTHLADEFAGQHADEGFVFDHQDLPLRHLRIAIVAARFNLHLTQRLVDGALGALADLGHGDVLPVYWVPGAFEIPIVAQRLAASGVVDAVVCLGAVVRGDTAHFEYVAGPCADGCARVALDTGIPVVFGVLTTNDEQQALDRCGGCEGNKGSEAATTAVETVGVLRSVPTRRDG